MTGFGALFFFISLWPPHQPHRLMKIEERKRMFVRLMVRCHLFYFWPGAPSPPGWIGGTRLGAVGQKSEDWMIAVQDGVV